MQRCSLHLSAPIWGRGKPQAGVPSACLGSLLHPVTACWHLSQGTPAAPWLPPADGELFQMKEWLEQGEQCSCCAGPQLHTPHRQKFQPLLSDPVNSR